MSNNDAFSEILRGLEPTHILDLIEVGQINTPESICEAYNAIVKKIIFDGAANFNMATFNKMEAYVKNLKNQSNDFQFEEIVHPQDNATTSRAYAKVQLHRRGLSDIEVEEIASTSKAQNRSSRDAQYGGSGVHQEQGDDITNDLAGPLKYLTIITEGVKRIKKFNIEGRTLVFKFNDVGEAANPTLWLQNAFDEVIEHVTEGSGASDKIEMILRNDNFPEKPIGISFRRVDQLSSAVILATLEKILQSNAAFFTNDTLRLHVDRITLPTGYGKNYVRLTGVDFEEFCRRKEGILVVKNNDNFCLAKALVLAMAWRSNDVDLEFLEFGGTLMQTRASRLCARAGVDLVNGGTREHIDLFQHCLTGYTIIVYNSHIGKTVYYEGPRAPERLVLNLILENNHYNVITNLVSAFSCKYFCELCRAHFNDKS